MKKIYILISVFIFLLLSSCKSVSFDGLKLSDEKATPNEFNFKSEGNSAYKDLNYINFYLKASPKNQMSESGEEKWASYMKSIMGVDVDIDYSEGEYFDNRVFANTDNTGMVVDCNTLDIASLSLRDSILDIKDILNINKYPSDVAKIVTSYTGDILVLPTYHDIDPLYRTYNADVLEKLNIPVPKTIEEFYQLAKAIKTYNSNSNEKMYIASFSYVEVLDAFADIFMAFGCYVDKNITNQFSSIAYNPLTNQFEYIIYNENITNAFLFIKMLYDEELIYYHKVDESNDAQIASYYNEKHNVRFENESYGLYLEGPSKNYMIYCQDKVGGISFLKNTDNVEQLVLFFENGVFPERNAQLMFTYGIEGEGYYVKDDILYINKENDRNTPNIRMEWFSEFSDSKYYAEDVIFDVNTEFEKNTKELIKNSSNDLLYRPKLYVDFSAILNESLNTNIYKVIDDANYRFTYEVIYMLTLGNDADAAVESLRSRMKNKIDTALELMNEFIK